MFPLWNQSHSGAFKPGVARVSRIFSFILASDAHSITLYQIMQTIHSLEPSRPTVDKSQWRLSRRRSIPQSYLEYLIKVTRSDKLSRRCHGRLSLQHPRQIHNHSDWFQFTLNSIVSSLNWSLTVGRWQATRGEANDAKSVYQALGDLIRSGSSSELWLTRQVTPGHHMDTNAQASKRLGLRVNQFHSISKERERSEERYEAIGYTRPEGLRIGI